MRRRSAAVVCAAALGLAAAAQAQTKPLPLPLPALTRIAAKLSGLPARHPVRVVMVSASAMQAKAVNLLDRDYPRERQTYDETLYRALGLLQANEPLRPVLIARQTRNVLGLYDPVARRIYVRSGPRQRQTVLLQIVHALQDQSFDLRRLSGLRASSRDAAFAALAAVNGHALFATELLGGRSAAVVRVTASRRPLSHTGSRIRLFVDLESAFPVTTGVRFAATLQNLGGKSAVLGSLKRFPATTEQIFHIDAYLQQEPALPIELPVTAAGYSLARDDTFGELDVRALLAIFQVPRLDHVGAGWGAGLSALYRNEAGNQAVALRLDWDSENDARQWGEAVFTYVNEAFDADVPGLPATTPCGAAACWSVGGRSIALAQAGARTALVFGPSVAAADALSRALVL